MNDDARLERIFADALSQTAPSRAPDRLRAAITTSVHQTRPRPRWLALLKEPPMQYTQSAAVGLPLARFSSRSARRVVWVMLLVGLTIALAGAAFVVGSRLLRGNDPNGFNGAVMVPTLALDQTWDATTIDGLALPSGMDFGPDGNLYVVNAGAGEIVVLDPIDGHVVRRWGSPGSGPGQFIFHGDNEDPLHAFGGIAVTPGGSVYVMDTKNDRVQQFDLRGTFVRQWGGYGTGEDQIILAFDLSDAPDGSIYVKDNGQGNIRRFAADGTYEATVATMGTGTGHISDDAGGIFVDAAGAVYSADGAGNQVQVWNPDGSYRGAIGHDGVAGSTLVYPYDVSVDSTGNVYATEPARMLVFTPDGTLASTWQIPGAAAPADGINPIAIAPDGTVYMSAWHRNVIFKLRATQREIIPTASTSPTASVKPSATVSPAASDLSPMAGSSLTPSGLAVTDTFAVPFTADQPPDWQVHWVKTGGVELSKPVPGSTTYIKTAVRVFVPTNAYADACHSATGPMSPPVGPTVDDLVNALTSIPGVRVSVPITDITIDGFAGKSFDLESTLKNADCPDDGAWFPMWTFDDAGTQAFAGPGSNFHQHIAVLDVHGTRVLIESWTFNDTSVTDLVDSQHVFDSIDFQ